MTTAALPPVGSVAAEKVDRTSARTVRQEPTVGRTLTRSIVSTTLVMFVLAGVPMWALTGEVWDGIGLGAFCAFWGGPGFGAMVGGILWTVRQERIEAQHEPGAGSRS